MTKIPTSLLFAGMTRYATEVNTNDSESFPARRNVAFDDVGEARFEAHDSVTAVLSENGIDVNDLTPDERDDLAGRLDPIFDAFVSDLWGEVAAEIVEDLLPDVLAEIIEDLEIAPVGSARGVLGFSDLHEIVDANEYLTGADVIGGNDLANVLSARLDDVIRKAATTYGDDLLVHGLEVARAEATR